MILNLITYIFVKSLVIFFECLIKTQKALYNQTTTIKTIKTKNTMPIRIMLFNKLKEYKHEDRCSTHKQTITLIA